MSTDSFGDLGADRALGSAVYRDEDFPGCESFHLPASEIDHYEGRLEFWDGATETAWKVPETPIQHEGPSRQLTQMAARLAMVRGSRISSLGSSDLVHLDAAGRKRWLMQADELLYLHRDLWSRLQGPAIDVDADPLPDVVLGSAHGDSALTRSGVDARRAPGVSEGVGGRLSCVAGVGGLRSGIGGPWRNRELMEPANDLCPSGTRKMHGTGEFVDREPFLGKEQRELGGKDGGEQLVEHEGVGVVELRSAKHAGEGRRRGPLGDAGEVGRGDYREQGMVVALGVREGAVVDGRRGFGIGKPGERHGFDGHGVFRFCGEDPKRLVRPTNE